MKMFLLMVLIPGVSILTGYSNSFTANAVAANEQVSESPGAPPELRLSLVTVVYGFGISEEIVAEILDAGYTEIELAVFDHDVPAEDSLQRLTDTGRMIRRLAKERDKKVQLHVVSGSTASADPTSLNEDIGRSGVAHLKLLADKAKAVGAKSVTGPTILPWKEHPQYQTGERQGTPLWGHDLVNHMQQRIDAAVPRVQEVADYYEEKDVVLYFEYLTHWESPGLNTLVDTAAFLKKVNRPKSFGVVIDMSHLALDGRGEDAFLKTFAEVVVRGFPIHIHVSAPHRGRVDQAIMPWHLVFGAIQGANSIDTLDLNPAISIEIFDAGVQAFSQGVVLTRPPYDEQRRDVIVAAAAHTRKHWESVPKFALEQGRQAVLNAMSR